MRVGGVRIATWRPRGPIQDLNAAVKRRIDRAAWIVERRAKELLSIEGTRSIAEVERMARDIPGYSREFAANRAFRRGKAGTTYVKLQSGKLVDRKRSPVRKYP